MNVRLFSALALLLIISSCAHNRIRKVRVAPRTVVKLDRDSESLHSNSLLVKKDNSPHSEKEAEESSKYSKVEVETLTEDDSGISQPLTGPEPLDSTYTNTPTFTEEEKTQAAMAEIHAYKSTVLFGISLGLILTLFPLALFLIPFGWYRYTMARNSAFSTAEGIRLERQALILGIVVTMLFITMVAITVITILLFL